MGRSDALLQILHVDGPVLGGDDQPKLAFLVLEEQVLAMDARQVAAQCLAFLDREHGGMVGRSGIDAKVGDIAEQVVSGFMHGGGMFLLVGGGRRAG